MSPDETMIVTTAARLALLALNKRASHKYNINARAMRSTAPAARSTISLLPNTWIKTDDFIRVRGGAGSK
jgi:hypothetical protein